LHAAEVRIITYLYPESTGIAFITAVDYFTYLYPAVPVDRVFSISYMFACFIPLVLREESREGEREKGRGWDGDIAMDERLSKRERKR